MSRLTSLTLLLTLLSTSCTAFDPLPLIDPLIGTQNGGNVFAGASRPYGLAKAVADVDPSVSNAGGFATDPGAKITGFSAAHDSGTGGNPSLGNFPLFPQVCPGDELDACRFRVGDRMVGWEADSVRARPGYFGVGLGNGVVAEMTVAERTAVMRFRFPAAGAGNETGKWNVTGNGEHPLVLLDLTDLWQSRQNASIVVDEQTGRMTGNGTFLPSFGAGSYVMHFCVDFFGADVFDSGVWVNNRAGTEPKEMFVTRGFNLFFIEAGAFVRFKNLVDGTVTARVGLSFISSEQACRSAQTEVPDPVGGFDSLVKSAEDAWREKLSPLSVVPGDGVSKDLQVSFWSGLYRTMISPQNYTGENPDWDTGRPYFDSFYW
jgi:putative alpha-1,2-mannosidase